MSAPSLIAHIMYHESGDVYEIDPLVHFDANWTGYVDDILDAVQTGSHERLCFSATVEDLKYLDDNGVYVSLLETTLVVHSSSELRELSEDICPSEGWVHSLEELLQRVRDFHEGDEVYFQTDIHGLDEIIKSGVNIVFNGAQL